ncbi:MAG: GMC family oxidoreductase [Campylobacterales bacterium]|nr:GMC family oxidoreductase [Campylobacterales bacterium]
MEATKIGKGGKISTLPHPSLQQKPLLAKLVFDICIIGSGAGAGPIAYELSRAGKKVAVLEKGEHYKREDFSKDEIAYTKRSIVTPNLHDEFHTIAQGSEEYPTTGSSWDFWNGNIVGGSSNFMSGFFHRLHPDDFRLLSKFGAIKGANMSDWAISYEELAPYYEKVEQIVGVSGAYQQARYEPPRQSQDFPYPPTTEHPITALIDSTAKKLGMTPLITPRAILSQDTQTRKQCYYSNYCGSYGCSSGAKGSSREALLNPALQTGNLKIIPNAYVIKLNEKEGKVVSATYIDKRLHIQRTIEANIFVVAAQAIETSRLLLNSTSANFPNGLGNNSGEVGKNLLFSGGGILEGSLDGSVFDLKKLMVEGYFVNRVIKDFYFMEGQKGGIMELLFEHANPIRKANIHKYEKGKLLWGEKLYDKLYQKFNHEKKIKIEIFNDWLPNDNCFVTIDKKRHDKYGIPVAKIAIASHPLNEKIGNRLAQEGIKLLKAMGAKAIESDITSIPPSNLQAGGCRFGNDPKTSVLDKNCKSHEVANLYVTDGSFMPTGGSVPYTFTIYANSFRVAEHLKAML